MIVMDRRVRKELDLFIRAHAQAMYDWGIGLNEEADLKKVENAWKDLNKFIDGKG